MYKVVLIDDEPWSAAVLQSSLNWKSLGFYIDKIYSSPVVALSEICTTFPDVVITDISMPIMDGLELIKRAQQDGCTSRFIILSAHRNFDYCKTAMKLDVVDYCLKPINPDDISELLMALKCELDSLNLLSPDDTMYQNRFEDILSYISDNISERLTLQSVSDIFFINRTYICSLFRKNLNTTFSQYLTDIRIERAKFLLSHTSMKLSEIGISTGFKDEFYFSKVFKKYLNMSPGIYRKLFGGK